MKIILNLIINTAAVMGIAYFMPEVTVDSLTTGILVAVVLGLLNTFIRPIIKLLTLPINVITLGLFTFVINAFIIWLTTLIVPGFEITGILTYLLFSILLSIVSSVLGWIF